jgi:hypothetical protein
MLENNRINRWLWPRFVCTGNFNKVQIIPNALKEKKPLRNSYGFITLSKNQWLIISEIYWESSELIKNSTFDIDQYLWPDDWALELW